MFCFISFFSGVAAEQVGQSAGKELLSSLSSGGCVDEHLQDQVSYSDGLYQSLIMTVWYLSDRSGSIT